MVSVLLKAGARTSSTNNMGKTAASMAAFVGQSVMLLSVGGPGLRVCILYLHNSGLDLITMVGHLY